MATIVNYTGDGTTNQFAVTFDYISRDNVVVKVNDVAVTFTFINDTTIQLTNTPASGAAIAIQRATPLTALVDFTDGSTLFEADLDLSDKQSRFLAEEARDRADSAITVINNNIADVNTVAANDTDISTVAGQISPTNNVQTLAEIQDGTTATGAITTAASISSAISNVSSISSAVSTVSSDSADVQTLAGISTDIQTLADIEDGTTATDAISDVAAIATSVSSVAGISTEVTNVAGKLTEIERLGTADAVADLAVLGTTDAVSDMNTLAAISADIETVADKASFITTDFVNDLNTLATTDVVADLNQLATSDIVADIALLADTDVIADLNTLATTDIVNDLNTLATTDIVADLNQLATSDFVADLNTMATTTNVNNLATVAGNTTNINAVAADATDIGAVAADLSGSDNIGTVAGGLTNINTVAGSITNVNSVATNITGVNSFAERYRVDSSDPTTSLNAGDLFFNTTTNSFKFYDAGASPPVWQTVNVSGIGSLADDVTPQLGGVLQSNGNNIEFPDSSGAENNRLKFGASDDLEIYFDGTDSNIVAAGGASSHLKIYVEDDLEIRHGTPSSSEVMASFTNDNAVYLYYNNSTRLYTSSSGVNVTGDLTTSDDLFVNGGFARIQASTAPTLQIKSTDTTGADNQELGSLEFYGSDSTSPGAGVKASIKGVVQDINGKSAGLQFSTTNSANETLAMEIDKYGNLNLWNNNSIRFYDNDDSHCVAIDVPTTVTETYFITLPAVGPDADQILVSDTNGNTVWENKPTGANVATQMAFA